MDSTSGHISESVGLAMNVPPDRYHAKANTELDEKEEATHSLTISWRYIKYCTRKTVYQKAVFFQSSYLLKEVKSIHWTIYIVYVNK